MNQGVDLFSSSAGTMALVALGMALLALGGAVFMLARQQRLLGQYQQLMTGTSGGNLEAILNDHVALVQKTASRVESLGDRALALERSARYTLRHLGVVRYNPFQDTGGDQSFAIALADDYGNGVVLSSLHARNGTRVYAKPMETWTSDYSLTEEEKEAIKLARQVQAQDVIG